MIQVVSTLKCVNDILNFCQEGDTVEQIVGHGVESTDLCLQNKDGKRVFVGNLNSFEVVKTFDVVPPSEPPVETPLGEDIDSGVDGEHVNGD